MSEHGNFRYLLSLSLFLDIHIYAIYPLLVQDELHDCSWCIMIHFIFLEYDVENNNLNSVIQKEQGS